MDALILRMYEDMQEKDPLILVRDDIHTCNQLIDMCQKELKHCQDSQQIVTIQEDIQSYKEQIINLQNIIDGHQKGETVNVTNITNIETNMQI
jgi:hypothetical protein